MVFISIFAFKANANNTALNFKADSVDYISDSTKAIVYRKNKTGIYDFGLNKFILKWTKDAIFELDSLNCFVVANSETISIIDFNCGDTLFPYQQKITAANTIKYLQKEKYQPYKRKLDNARFEQHDSFTGGYTWTLYQANKNWFIIENEQEFGFKKLTIERFNDSLLIVQNYEQEYIDPYTEPVKSLLYPEEDSTMLDPETGFYYAFYPTSGPGYEHSGIFNLNSRKWFIAPSYEGISITKKGFLLRYTCSNILVDYDLVKHHTHISFTGDTLFHGKLVSELTLNKDFINEMLSEQEIVKITDYPAKLSNDNCLRSKYELQYLLNNKGDWSIIDFSDEDSYINPIAMTQPKEWVHYDPVYKQYYWLENDSICTQLNWKTYKVSQNNGQLIVQINRSNKAQRKITLIEGADTTVINHNYTENETELDAYVNIVVKENLLLLNHWDQTLRIPEEDRFDLEQGFFEKYRGYRLIEYENEASTVWQKKEGVWTKQLPYFAEVTKVPFGFLARTGDFFEFTDPENGIFKHKESRFLLFDDNFKPISYMDFYDFAGAKIYPFGLALLSETGYFLVDNNAKPITSANWEDFILETGKIKAVNYYTEDDDEYYDPAQFGAYSEVEFFNIE